MASPLTVLSGICLFVGFLFLMALLAEKTRAGRALVNHPLVYSLGLTVLYTSWTFYGAVGKAATTGMMFFSLYLGTMMPLFFWWTIVRKMVRIKNAYRITSIADFISARYDKSPGLAALATSIAVIGVMPYIALQLKSIGSTFTIISLDQTAGLGGLINRHSGLIITGLMILFTIVFGVRRLDPTERHPGMVMAVAVEGVFKLLAFLLIGLFVVYYMCDGLTDVFDRFSRLPGGQLLDLRRNDAAGISVWASYMVISMCAVMFLPRQFHMTVVENPDEGHIRTAMWFLPLYMLLITFLCFPVALGGLLHGLPADQADTFVLRLPFAFGSPGLSLLVFLGGFAASTGMVMICAMTMATMMTNHLLLPLIEWVRPLGFLRRRLLECRWAAVAFTVLTGYFFERTVGGSYMLVNMGVISFAAVSQFAPAILGGLFWRRGNKAGAFLGLAAGFGVWFYTMMLPAFAWSGWISDAFIRQGPFGFGFLKPEQLFGLTSINPITNTVFWSLALNVAGYVLGSVWFQPTKEGQRLAEDFVGALGEAKPVLRQEETGGPSVLLTDKTARMTALLEDYFFPPAAGRMVEECLAQAGVKDRKRVSILEFARLYDSVERALAGAIGAAAARAAMEKSGLFSRGESELLSAQYAELLARLRISPEELRRRIDYYQEREALLSAHAAELAATVKAREEEIAQRRFMEAELKKAEEKYRGIFENAVEGMFQTTPDGRFISVNRAMARLLGYDSPEELVQKVTDIRTQLWVTPHQREEFLGLAAKHGSISGYEAQHVRKNGTTMWSSIHARPVLDESGNLVLIEGTFQDITARKKAEEEKALLEEQLRQSQKMEAIGKLTGGIAHDFNNLLHAISGYVQLLLRKKGKGDPDHDHLVEIARAVAKASDIVQRLLTFSRKMEARLEAVDLNRVVRDTVKMLEHTIPRMISIETRLDSDLAVIQADPIQMEQALVNLAGNACEAMPHGGRLSIRTENVRREDGSSGQYREVEPGDFVRLEVTDTGLGMDPATREHIFEPFFTTKEVGKGTGLGLSIVYGIVKGHGGHITCRSAVGQGTTFEIFLPAGHGLKAGYMETAPLEDEIEGGHETILLVDDEQGIIDVVKEMLAEYGYKVLTADSGERALELYAQADSGIGAVVLDLGMPGMGGERCLEELLKIDPEARVIVASGYTAHKFSEDPGRYGAAAFMSKPYLLTDMLAKIREVLDRD
ncbi:MAG: ATP-binding protein [Thermodesulfobacteriota bacterium]